VGRGESIWDYFKAGALENEEPQFDAKWNGPEFERGYAPRDPDNKKFDWAVFGEQHENLSKLAQENLERYKFAFAPLENAEDQSDAEAALAYKMRECVRSEMGSLYGRSALARYIPTGRVGRMPRRSFVLKMLGGDFFPSEMRKGFAYPIGEIGDNRE
jgi:hypothetical protein